MNGLQLSIDTENTLNNERSISPIEKCCDHHHQEDYDEDGILLNHRISPPITEYKGSAHHHPKC